VTETALTGNEPVYAVYVPYKRIEYYFNWGDSFVRKRGVVVGHHEGDREHIAIKLDGSSNSPVRVPRRRMHMAGRSRHQCMLWSRLTRSDARSRHGWRWLEFLLDPLLARAVVEPTRGALLRRLVALCTWIGMRPFSCTALAHSRYAKAFICHGPLLANQVIAHMQDLESGRR